jgi:hypothetical protein
LETGVFGHRRKSLLGNELFFGDLREVDFLFQKSPLATKEAALGNARSATTRQLISLGRSPKRISELLTRRI